ncbi:glycosyltransferase [Lentisphaerota bacterium WC36G]|nr:hypothetical protein LJT99_15815 [Lentisphaerae bacterium WC36]
MHSFIHCFWTGNSFPYALRSFIKKWTSYLRKSHSKFELIVWLTEDSLSAFEGYMAQNKLGSNYNADSWQSVFDVGAMRFNKAKLNFQHFYVCRFEDLLREHHKSLQDSFQLFTVNKRFTSASNLARLMIINKCGGIYTDIDYLLPNEARPFPSDIFEIIKVFKQTSDIRCYFSITELNTGHYLAENQCIVLAPAFCGYLRELFDRIDFLLTKAYMPKLITEVESEHQYLENEITQRLNKSFFCSGNEKNLLTYYQQKSYDRFNYTNTQLYRGQKIFGVYSWPTKNLRVTDPAMLQSGMRHSHYDLTGLLTYGVVTAFFERHLIVSREDYYREGYQDFIDFFDREHIESQFEFVDFLGDKHGMYSWANPGYSRLVKLEKTAKTINKYRSEKKQFIPKVILLNFTKECLNIQTPIPHISRRSLVEMIEAISVLPRNYLQISDATSYLKTILSSMVTNLDANSSMAVFSEVLISLNLPIYAKVKNLIDPEKTTLTSSDIYDFCII